MYMANAEEKVYIQQTDNGEGFPVHMKSFHESTHNTLQGQNNFILICLK